ncbi:SMC-Scp complex subunit ScpB [Fodinicurvata fenggangensis]|uniref:SMC-Scp complex subunit ScpB n=1 Tax=Fodinicurvata fenggangensis TaxID=1121830 RepID=UPI0009E02904|nr:SMC-Scp complex subunit ScpB [Fodinicurvata fenggangensis]
MDEEQRFKTLRLLEAVLFASETPLTEKQLAAYFPEDADLATQLEALQAQYANRGVVLEQVNNAWAFRTAADLGPDLRREKTTYKKLSKAAVDTLAIIAYHQPVTRAEIEEIRGVSLSKGTLDTLLEAEWVKPRGRRRTPGRPLTWGTTESFLDHFGLESLSLLPGVEELKAAGLLDTRPAITALGERGLLGADAQQGEGETEAGKEEDSLDEQELDSLIQDEFSRSESDGGESRTSIKPWEDGDEPEADEEGSERS